MQQLRMLREVSHRGTISAAAESLNYTPSAVSQQLAALERSSGVAVLERVGRNVRLTDAGRELVRHAGDLLAGMERAQAALEQVNSEVKGTIDVTVFESIAGTLVVPMLELAGQRYPDLTVRVALLEPDLALEQLARGEIDLAFAMDYSHTRIVPADGIEFDEVLTEPFKLIVPPGEGRHGDTASLDEFADRGFIFQPSAMSCGRSIVEACRSAGFEPRLAHSIDDYPVIARMVSAGHGVAMIAALGVSAAVDQGVDIGVIDLDPPITRSVMIGYRSVSAERPAVRAVRDLVAEVAAPFAAGSCRLAS